LNSGLFSLPLVPAESAAGLRGGERLTAGETFFAGPENALVCTLAEEVVAAEIAFNPLVLYGPSGVGKSSLAHTLAGRRRVRLGLKNVIATTGAQLARGLAEAIESDSVTDFRERHHRCDIILIDDLEQLTGKSAAQQFLLATLDSLLHRGSLVLATLRSVPQTVDGLLPTLRSRLAGGLIVRLAPPGVSARKALVAQAAARVSQPLDDAVVEQLAGRGTRLATAAKLRHAVFELAVAAEVQRRAIRPTHVSRWLSQQSPDASAVCRRVTSLVCEQSGLTAAKLRSKSRSQAIADARSLAMYLIRRLCGLTYSEIGRQFGRRDHTTVLHSCQKVEKLIARDDAVRRQVEQATALLAADAGV
jgi:chromosomal replication initiator protein